MKRAPILDVIIPPEANPDIYPVLYSAIDQRHLIHFLKKDRERIVEPHDYGIHKGVVKLFGFQVGGYSSESLPGWRWFEEELIRDIKTLEKKFPGGRGASSSRHNKWDKIFIRVKPADEDD